MSGSYRAELPVTHVTRRPRAAPTLAAHQADAMFTDEAKHPSDRYRRPGNGSRRDWPAL